MFDINCVSCQSVLQARTRPIKFLFKMPDQTTRQVVIYGDRKHDFVYYA